MAYFSRPLKATHSVLDASRCLTPCGSLADRCVILGVIPVSGHWHSLPNRLIEPPDRDAVDVQDVHGGVQPDGLVLRILTVGTLCRQ